MSKILTILQKDVLSEMRSKELAASVLFFALLVIVVFSFAFDPETDVMETAAAGVLWVAFTFAGVLGLNRAFAQEKENECLEGLMLCPTDRDVIYWGKLTSSFIFMLTIEAIITPIFLVLFDLPLFMPELGLIVMLATVGFVSVGTLFSALAANTRAKDILLPILFFPVAIPVIIAAVKASQMVFDDRPFGDLTSWLLILVAFDAIFLTISALVFEFVIEE
ncbi:MAG: heme exporter protein CcmB [Chloroflexota bacterium]|nr:heme exporter protein CcmB [Chloroflexota bacterium]